MSKTIAQKRIEVLEAENLALKNTAERVIEEYHLKSCDCSEPLAEEIDKLEQLVIA